MKSFEDYENIVADYEKRGFSLGSQKTIGTDMIIEQYFDEADEKVATMLFNDLTGELVVIFESNVGDHIGDYTNVIYDDLDDVMYALFLIMQQEVNM